MLGHPWVLGWAVAQGEPADGDALGLVPYREISPRLPAAARLGRPHPLCQRRVAEGHHGSPSSRETCLTLCALPRNKRAGGGGEGGCKLGITTN